MVENGLPLNALDGMTLREWVEMSMGLNELRGSPSLGEPISDEEYFRDAERIKAGLHPV